MGGNGVRECQIRSLSVHRVGTEEQAALTMRVHLKSGVSLAGKRFESAGDAGRDLRLAYSLVYGWANPKYCRKSFGNVWRSHGKGNLDLNHDELL